MAISKTRQLILDRAGYLGKIDTGDFTQRHFNELANMEDEGLIKQAAQSSRSDVRVWFLTEEIK